MYLPQPMIIREITQENHLVKTFRLARADGAAITPFAVGQFVMLSVPHCGEAPISISSEPADSATLDLTIREAGKLTRAVQKMAVGETLGVRGPYGRPFPVADLLGQDLLLVAGGIGLAPLKGVLDSCLAWKGAKGLAEVKLSLCYGSRTPADICFSGAISQWQEQGVDCRLTVDEGDDEWDGHTGLVTELLRDFSYPGHGHALVCGPPVMIRATMAKLIELGWPPEMIFTTLERHMKCGVGVCGHCHLDDKLVCTDGPVFSGAELAQMTVAELAGPRDGAGGGRQ
ncbi:MAG: FAD/NAD(P)-binding protein [Thermodesulfobacteriota bacterium]